jgi:hypothetical protein
MPVMRGEAPVAMMTVFARISRSASELARHRGEIDRLHERLLEARAELRRLLAQVLHQLEAVDALGKAGEILDLARRRELAAGQRALEHERAEVGAAV